MQVRCLHYAALAATAAVLAALTPAASASVYTVCYQSQLLGNVDEAVNIISGLRRYYVDWDGREAVDVHVDKTGAYFTMARHLTGTQWVPSNGGVFIGGHYVPYYGGAFAPSDITDQEQYVVSIRNITRIAVMRYPDLPKDNKFGFNLKLADNKIVMFRTPDLETAEKLADAFETLRAANFEGNSFLQPSLCYSFATKEIADKEFKRLHWTRPGGIVIGPLDEGSPLLQAGIKTDDIIYEADGQPVQLDEKGGVNLTGIILMTFFRTGETAHSFDLKVFRDGQSFPAKLTVKNPNIGIDALRPLGASQPASPAAADKPAPGMAPGSAAQNGNGPVEQWYQPGKMASLDEAVRTFAALQSAFVTGSGKPIAQLTADRSGVRIQPETPANAQPVPEIWIPADKITVVDLYYVASPSTAADFKWMLAVYYLKDSGGKEQSTYLNYFRTRDRQTAETLARAFHTLRAAAGVKLAPAFGLDMVGDSDQATAAMAKLNWTNGGALINFVITGSPAAAAGLQKDDIITDINGRTVTNYAAFVKIRMDILEDKPEATLELKVFRAGQIVPVRVSAVNPNYSGEGKHSAAAPQAGPVQFGATVASPSAQQAKAAGVDDGLIVNAVDPGSVAEQLGVRVGDVITEINGRKIVDTASVKRALSSGAVDAVKVRRKGKTVTLTSGTKI